MYLSKQTILDAFKRFYDLSADYTLQGATQITSEIRHFLALNAFYKNNNRNCNTKNKSDNQFFIEEVKRVVGLTDSYSVNLANKTNTDSDCNVNSNFFSAGVVSKSVAATDKEFDYPSKSPALIKVKNGELIYTKEYVNNINEYLRDDLHKVALIIWLARNVNSIKQEDIYGSIENYLRSIYTSELVDSILVDRAKFANISEKDLKITLSDTPSNIGKNDISQIYSSSKVKEDKKKTINSKDQDKNKHCVQKIFFGAPGTGKSTKIFNMIDLKYDNVFRTTFHPDYDYSSFVGSFKPTVLYHDNDTKIKTLEELADELKETYNNAGPKANGYKYTKSGVLHIFILNNASYFNGKIANYNFRDLLKKAHLSSRYSVEAYKILEVENYLSENGYLDNNGVISYDFIPQVFTDAYVRAWKEIKENPSNPKPVFLIIEEINRGNCAQIFGDLFQLLDRGPDCISQFPIKADIDLRNYLIKTIGKDSDGIKNNELRLPANFNIYATMNTSDQSLFPIDSAFKRRFDWEYVPIDYNKEACKGFMIKVLDKEFPWLDFIKKVNAKIKTLTDSEDKQLGEFFVKDSLEADEFKSKVMFFLWNDVCRDYSSDNPKYFFRYKDAENNTEIPFTFRQLFEEENHKGDNILKGFLEYISETED